MTVNMLATRKIMSLDMFKSFDDDNYIEEDNIKLVKNYICWNLYSWLPNRAYWERQYNMCNKLYLACNWRKKRNLRAIAKKGKTVCGGELFNFLADEKHKSCICLSC